MTARNYALLAAAIFAVIGVLQLSRAVIGAPITAGSISIPIWPSWVAFLACAILAWLGYNASR
jgi:hypothetical protein